MNSTLLFNTYHRSNNKKLFDLSKRQRLKKLEERKKLKSMPLEKQLFSNTSWVQLVNKTAMVLMEDSLGAQASLDILTVEKILIHQDTEAQEATDQVVEKAAQDKEATSKAANILEVMGQTVKV